MGKPAAEIELPIERVGELVLSQHPDLAELPIVEVASGWDNMIFRLGADMAIRLPRRLSAVKLLEHEQRWLPILQRQLPLPVPSPLRVGCPQNSYPWPWSITPWIEGETADRVSLDSDQGAALATFLEALHTAPPAQAPRNPYRGVPLAQHNAQFSTCVSSLQRRGRTLDGYLLQLWDAAVETPIDAAPTWIHGDLHSHNVLAASGRICGVIDWGDVAQGDRATDLAATWILFSQGDARERVLKSCRSVSTDTWRRARGWALLLAVVVLDAADPALVTVAELTLQRLVDGP